MPAAPQLRTLDVDERPAAGAAARKLGDLTSAEVLRRHNAAAQRAAAARQAVEFAADELQEAAGAAALGLAGEQEAVAARERLHEARLELELAEAAVRYTRGLPAITGSR